MVTKEELEKLPVRAVVAFAVRCAMRVRPLHEGEDSDVVDIAINVARRRAAGENLVLSPVTDADMDRDNLVSSVAIAAYRASTSNLAKAAHEASSAAAAADAAVAAARLMNPVEGIAADFQRIKKLAEQGAKTFDVSESGPLGPLWPKGLFVGKANIIAPALTGTGSGEFSPPPSLEFLIDPGVASREDFTKLFTAMTRLFRACGGDCGLDFMISEARERAEVLQ